MVLWAVFVLSTSPDIPSLWNRFPVVTLLFCLRISHFVGSNQHSCSVGGKWRLVHLYAVKAAWGKGGKSQQLQRSGTSEGLSLTETSMLCFLKLQHFRLWTNLMSWTGRSCVVLITKIVCCSSIHFSYSSATDTLFYSSSHLELWISSSTSQSDCCFPFANRFYRPIRSWQAENKLKSKHLLWRI